MSCPRAWNARSAAGCTTWARSRSSPGCCSRRSRRCGWCRAPRYRLIVLALGVTLVAIVPVLIALQLDAPGIGQRGFILVGLAWQWAFESHERGWVALST